MEKGNISIHSENIMPIIKKWLYSDKDIFIRELIANGCDAITKHKKLTAMGEAKHDDAAYEIHLTIDPQQKTLTFSDNGIGMTEDEVKKYINQVAFSGAVDFIEKYEQSGDEAIIGHFGLGFYSSFMVSTRVSIDTLSFQEGAKPVHWTSDGGIEFEMGEGKRDSRGTSVTLNIDDDNHEFLKYSHVKDIVDKYCAFLPIEIFIKDFSKDEEIEKKKAEATEKGEDFSKIFDIGYDIEPCNDTHPLWLKNSNDISDEEYKEFYRKVFHSYDDPLFWIHLNVDYPFNLKGILYFPQLSKQFDVADGKIKLYNNQVYVADNIKEVIPEFLMLLKGVIDCPDLPLNVSRSFLQNDGTVVKMQQHITKKVADKLQALFNVERENYENYWKDIHPFIKYGVLKDEKFYDQVKDVLLFEKIEGGFWTLSELQAFAKDNGGRIFYANDRHAQSYYIDMFIRNDQKAIYMESTIDNHFISFLEYKIEGISFGRIDSEVAQSVKGEYKDMPDQEALQTLMRKVTGKDNLNVEVVPLKAGSIPAMLVIDEQMRRFSEMSARFGGQAPIPLEGKLVLNGTSAVIKSLLEKDEEKSELIASYVYDIALMARGMMDESETKGFIERSSKILDLIG